MRSGYVNIYNGQRNGSGLFGYDWSSIPPSNGGYALGFTASGVNPSANVNRWFAFPLRCLGS